MIGQTISHYRVTEELGQGGMGVVYKAVDEKLDRTVALKFLPPHLSSDPESKARFIQEAKSASSLDHQNICTIHEVGETEDGQIFIAMACYDGSTIRKEIADGTLSVERAVNYSIQIAEGLATAHEAGIVHRDIKPGNLMVAEREVVKILDFGLAKVTDLSLSATGKRYGTVRYMSPEQARGERVDNRTDIWSVGAVLYEMLTGVRPFDAPYETAILFAIINVDPVPLREHDSEIPKALEDIVLRCLAKDPADRYASSSEMVADLKRLQEGAKAVAATDYRAIMTRRRVIKRVATFSASILAVLFLVMAIPSLRNAILPVTGPFPELNGLAVLPSINAAGLIENQPILDGIIYLVTNKLTRIEQFHPQIWVRPYSDVIRFNVETPEQAVNNLNVSHSVMQEVRLDDDAIYIKLDLVEPRSGRILRSVDLNETLSEVGNLEHEIIKKMSSLLQLELSSDAYPRLTSGGTTNPEAYTEYLRGQGALARYGNEGNVDCAIQHFESALEDDSLYVLAKEGLGYAFYQKYLSTRDRSWIEDAILIVEDALEIEPSSASAHFLLGFLFESTNQDYKAESEYRLTLELDTTNRAAYLQLAGVLEDQDKLEDAEQAYLDAISSRPDYWEFYFDFGFYHGTASHHDEAVTQFRRVIELAPSYVWAYNNLAVQYQQIGRTDDADSLYRLATQVNPTATRAQAYAFHNLGLIRYDEDDFSDAAAMYSKSLALDSTYTSAWNGMGDSYHWLVREDDARQMWQRGMALLKDELELDPESATALRKLALTQAKLGLSDEALIILVRLRSIQRLTPTTLKSIGTTYEILGYRAEALSFIHQALDEGYSVEMLGASRWLDGFRLDRDYLCRYTGDPCYYRES